MPPNTIPLMLNPSMLATFDLPSIFNLSTSANIAISPGNGRGGGSSIRCTYASATKVGCTFPPGASFNTVSFNCAIRPTILPILGSVELVEFLDTTTTQVSFAINPQGQIEAWRGVMGADILFGVSSARIIPNRHNQLEVRAFFSATTGTMIAWLNEQQILSFSSLNTIPSGSGFANSCFFGCSGGTESAGGFYDYSDIHFANGTMGEKKIILLDPTGAGTLSDFTPVGSAANYSAVNESPQNGDTSYVLSSTIGQHDSYVLSDLPTNSILMAVSYYSVSKKTDTGTRRYKPLYRIGSTNYLGTEFPTIPSAAYGFFFDNRPNSPATSIPWTAAEVNGMEVGRELSL